MTWTHALGWLASAAVFVRLVPQPVRLARSGVAAGVSPLAAMNATLTTVGWTVYGVIEADPIIWVVSVFALVPSIWANVLLAPKAIRRDVAVAASWAAVLVSCGAIGVLGAALAFGVVVSQGPQVVRAVRERDLTGVSPATWWLSMLDATTWGAYGVAVDDRALVAYGIVLGTSSLVVLGRVWWTRRAGTTAVEAGAEPAVVAA